MSGKVSWLEDIADRTISNINPQGKTIICASGISPSGHIHLGNMMELMTPHLVAETIIARGLNAEHVLFWDDFDSLRKVPAGQPDWLHEHIGRPLTSIPDPNGQYVSYADSFIAEFERGIKDLQIPIRVIRQSEEYLNGSYSELVRLAMAEREKISRIIDESKTGFKQKADAPLQPEGEYFPFKPYCEIDDYASDITSYNDDTSEMTYCCPNCNHNGTMSLYDTPLRGKLSWKVDWPMRWSKYGIDFEPGGMDHATPGSSFSVGKRLVAEIFGGTPPEFVGYSFVGRKGYSSKMSSSRGDGITPDTILNYIEPAMLRWMYAKRSPSSSFEIDLSAGGIRGEYDRWDAANRKSVSNSGADDGAIDLSVKTSAGDVPYSIPALRFSALASTLDMVHGDVDRALSIILQSLKPDTEIKDIDSIAIRIDRALRFIEEILPASERIVVQDEFDHDYYEGISEVNRVGLALLVSGIDEHRNTVAELELFIYSIPRLINEIPMDAPKSDELKVAQSAFFKDVYQLILGKDRGPRLSTLLSTLDTNKLESLVSCPVTISPISAQHL